MMLVDKSYMLRTRVLPLNILPQSVTQQNNSGVDIVVKDNVNTSMDFVDYPENKDIRYIKKQHGAMLAALEIEIEKLRLKNKDLQEKLILNDPSPETPNLECVLCKKSEIRVKNMEEEISKLMTDLRLESEKNRALQECMDKLQSELKSVRTQSPTHADLAEAKQRAQHMRTPPQPLTSTSPTENKVTLQKNVPLDAVTVKGANDPPNSMRCTTSQLTQQKLDDATVNQAAVDYRYAGGSSRSRPVSSRATPAGAKLLPLRTAHAHISKQVAAEPLVSSTTVAPSSVTVRSKKGIQSGEGNLSYQRWSSKLDHTESVASRKSSVPSSLSGGFGLRAQSRQAMQHATSSRDEQVKSRGRLFTGQQATREKGRHNNSSALGRDDATSDKSNQNSNNGSEDIQRLQISYDTPNANDLFRELPGSQYFDQQLPCPMEARNGSKFQEMYANSNLADVSAMFNRCDNQADSSGGIVGSLGFGLALGTGALRPAELYSSAGLKAADRANNLGSAGMDLKTTNRSATDRAPPTYGGSKEACPTDFPLKSGHRPTAYPQFNLFSSYPMGNQLSVPPPPPPSAGGHHFTLHSTAGTQNTFNGTVVNGSIGAAGISNNPASVMGQSADSSCFLKAHGTKLNGSGGTTSASSSAANLVGDHVTTAAVVGPFLPALQQVVGVNQASRQRMAKEMQQKRLNKARNGDFIG